MVTVLKSVQTWSEYKEVMEHLTSDGRRIRPKPPGGDDETWRLGEETLLDFLDGLQQWQWQYRKLRLFLQHRKNLPKKPDTNMAAVPDNGIAMA